MVVVGGVASNFDYHDYLLVIVRRMMMMVLVILLVMMVIMVKRKIGGMKMFMLMILGSFPTKF